MALRIHRSDEPTPHARGLAFGQAQAAAVACTVRGYRRLLAEANGLGAAELERAGAAVRRLLLREAPELHEEIAGIAAGARQSELELCAINARSELLAGFLPPECSVLSARAGADGGGGVVLAQNWDFHPDLAGAWVVWIVETGAGAWFATLTEAGIVGKLGLNHHGIGIAVNLLSTTADGGVECGIPMHVLLRRTLERCATVEQAVALLCAAEVSASWATTIASAHGGAPALTVERSPGGSAVVDAVEGTGHGHTNHFLRAPARGRDRTPGEWPESLARMETVRAHLRAGRPLDALTSHEGAPFGICRHDDPSLPYADQSVTLFSVVMDLAAPSLHVAAGLPCEAPLERVELPS